MKIEDKKLLEKLEFEQARVEDIVYSFARKNGLNEFYSKWTSKEYSDSDHNLPNMICDFLDALGQETHTIFCKRCETEIGESESDDNGSAVCLDCYGKKEETK